MMLHALILFSILLFQPIDERCTFTDKIEIFNLYPATKKSDARKHAQRSRNRYEGIAAVLVVDGKLDSG